MKRVLMASACTFLALSLMGCDSFNKQEAGALTGAAAGGLIGSRFGKGTGQTAAIIGGAVLGAFIGGKIGKTMDENDRLKTQQALERTPTQHTTSWRNPDSGNRYSVTPTKTYYEGNEPCREYQTTATINGEQQKMFGRACRQADGSWKAVS